MKVQIFKIKEDTATGFILYKRAKSKVPGFAPWPLYFINNPITKNYFQEFNTIKDANKTFDKLIKN
jgi:hypothetical protein